MKTVHICEICNNQYLVKSDAIACEAKTPKGLLDGNLRDSDTAEIGDLVSCGGHYSWWSGAEAWRFKMDKSHKFYKFAHRGEEHEFLYHPLWVVVNIVQDDRHRLYWILATPSNAGGQPQIAKTCCDHYHIINHGKASDAMNIAATTHYDPSKRVLIV